MDNELTIDELDAVSGGKGVSIDLGIFGIFGIASTEHCTTVVAGPVESPTITTVCKF
jgi:bacteriocin-like protein